MSSAPLLESPVKLRVLTKVRRHFLHKRPFEDEDQDHHANLVVTPEQVNEDTGRLLEPSLLLGESARTVSAGAKLLNRNFKINSTAILHRNAAKVVTIGLEPNGVDMLPWEYCSKRLESYGNLDLATWSHKLRDYREDYANLMAAYYKIYRSNDPEVASGIARCKARAALISRELEDKYYYKVIMYANKDMMVPISFSYSEDLLTDMGHTAEEFVEWTRENGIPTIIGGEYPVHPKMGKLYMKMIDYNQEYFHAGSTLNSFLYDKHGSKKKLNLKLFFTLEPQPEGFFVNGYMLKKDIKSDAGASASKNDDANSSESESNLGWKQTKKDEEDTADETDHIDSP